MNRAERLARLLRVLAAIISEPGLNPLELAERAGVSERTLRRDLAQLRDLGYEVAYTSGYEVQEKLNLEGRRERHPRAEGARRGPGRPPRARGRTRPTRVRARGALRTNEW